MFNFPIILLDCLCLLYYRLNKTSHKPNDILIYIVIIKKVG